MIPSKCTYWHKSVNTLLVVNSLLNPNVIGIVISSFNKAISLLIKVKAIYYLLLPLDRIFFINCV